MSSDESPPSPPSPSARRSSFSPGQLFGRSSTHGSGGASAYPTPIVTAAANAQAQQRRRLSISSLGLSGSPTQNSAFANMRARQGSISGSSNTTSVDENAIEEGEAAPLSSSPTSPFARRMSFGARALRDVRVGPGNSNGRASTTSVPAPSVKGRGWSSVITSAYFNRSSKQADRHTPLGEGFNWSEQLRSRAERSASVNSPPTSAPAAPAREQPPNNPPPPMDLRAKESPKPRKAPDHFQERILKGDFYMD
ncbi:MAG: hypothetical protein LQ342_004562 [Letrouitia transgressa]|nr:MAG: hypothetical protein LQ342_004562 [Letrouitia transgressa]